MRVFLTLLLLAGAISTTQAQFNEKRDAQPPSITAGLLTDNLLELNGFVWWRLKHGHSVIAAIGQVPLLDGYYQIVSTNNTGWNFGAGVGGNLVLPIYSKPDTGLVIVSATAAMGPQFVLTSPYSRHSQFYAALRPAYGKNWLNSEYAGFYLQGQAAISQEVGNSGTLITMSFAYDGLVNRDVHDLLTSLGKPPIVIAVFLGVTWPLN